MTERQQTVLPAARLIALKNALLRLHKALLERERLTYEKVHGRVESSGELLQLVVNHEHFAWLHVISALVVQIDEALDSEEDIVGIARELFEQAKSLLIWTAPQSDFQTRYRTARDDDPDVLLAHGAVSRTLLG